MCKRCFKFVIAILLILYPNNNVFAYSDEITHPGITKRAVGKKHSQLDVYLKSNLGYANGIATRFTLNSKKLRIEEWLQEGSIKEDKPSCRASNHFHDPTKAWDQSFMSDAHLTYKAELIMLTCEEEGWSLSDRRSNVTWATGFLAPSPDGSKSTFNSNPYYAPENWDKAREYYYNALTSAQPEDIESNFALTFRALGHVIHLLEDMAVPAHVRNDFTSHLKWNGLSEAMQEWDYEKLVIQPYEYYVMRNPNLVNTIDLFSSDFPSFNNTGLTDFWDTDQYHGHNPSASSSLGLAEYTNANYFSLSTIWNNNPLPEHYYFYPNVSNTDYQICVGWNPGNLEYRRYISRTAKGPCPPVYEIEKIDHFALVSLKNTESKIMENDLSQLILELDDNVYRTYAKELVPRAIGYSAKLLDYFFRGDIHLVEDSSGPNAYKIKNNSSEDMNGMFELYYDGVHDSNGNPLPDGQLLRKPITSLQGQAVSWQGQVQAGSEGGQLTIDNYPMDFPQDKKGEVFLVFQGEMGNEDLAVAGRRDKIGDLGLVGYYVRETSNDYTGQTDGSFSSCNNNNPQFGDLTGYDQLSHVYQKKFSNGTDNFYLIKEQYILLDTTGHKVVIYNTGTGVFETLIVHNNSQDVSFNASDDLQNVYVAIQGEYWLEGYKYIRNGDNWALDSTNTWSADLGYVKKDGTIIATKWENQDKQKMNLDIETGSLSVVSSNLYSVTNSIIDGNYTPAGTQCGTETYSCRYNNSPNEYYCGKTCSAYVGTRGDSNSSVQSEDFLYYRSGGTGEYIEDIKTKTTTSAIKYVNNWFEHNDCSEIGDDRCSNTSDSNSDINCEKGTYTNFLNSTHSSSINYDRTSSGSTYQEKTLSCGSWCDETTDVSTSSSTYSCNWNGYSGGTSTSVLWTGNDFWKLVSNSSSSRARSGDDVTSCPSPSGCYAGGNFSQWFSQYTLGDEISSANYSMNTPYGSINFGSLPPDQYVFFYLEDAFENNIIEGVKYHLNGTWYVKLYLNGTPFDLLNCIGSTAEDFQFPMLLQ